MELRAAEASDLVTILNWVANERECQMWAGPAICYTATPELIWSDIHASQESSFVLLNTHTALAGFGQLRLRAEQGVHLARLIVDPELRGQGIGKQLCRALMKEGTEKHKAPHFTLNVYESNKGAIKLYQSLGFEIKTKDKAGLIAMFKMSE
ncbi:GNAT family N-acetyltransferase [Aliidiomarina minuta]|nr:N-acetyltransferase [Aliidiomarina minuta]